MEGPQGSGRRVPRSGRRVPGSGRRVPGSGRPQVPAKRCAGPCAPWPLPPSAGAGAWWRLGERVRPRGGPCAPIYSAARPRPGLAAPGQGPGHSSFFFKGFYLFLRGAGALRGLDPGPGRALPRPQPAGAAPRSPGPVACDTHRVLLLPGEVVTDPCGPGAAALPVHRGGCGPRSPAELTPGLRLGPRRPRDSVAPAPWRAPGSGRCAPHPWRAPGSSRHPPLRPRPRRLRAMGNQCFGFRTRLLQRLRPLPALLVVRGAPPQGQGKDYHVAVLGAAGLAKGALVRRWVRGGFQDACLPGAEGAEGAEGGPGAPRPPIPRAPPARPTPAAPCCAAWLPGRPPSRPPARPRRSRSWRSCSPSTSCCARSRARTCASTRSCWCWAAAASRAAGS
uniref:Uncharacterized protein n=1 Tax=Canis lupus familiaris TaxID=9615 RepID=A0A8P0PNV0_CANLF